MKALIGACIGAILCWALIWAAVAFISADVLWPVDLWDWNSALAGPIRFVCLIPFFIATVWAMATGADEAS